MGEAGENGGAAKDLLHIGQSSIEPLNQAESGWPAHDIGVDRLRYGIPRSGYLDSRENPIG